VTDRSGGRSGAANAEPRIEVGLATDVGQVRTGNEDSIICEPIESLVVSERGLFCAVADGMGGHAAGEDASSMAVKVARDAFYGAWPSPRRTRPSTRPGPARPGATTWAPR
jgi:serine/threonine protein phosphatase PrpC